MLAFLHASTALLALFFYPIHHIGFVHLQYFPYASSADSSVVHFDCQLPGLFRVFVPFRVYGVIDAALLRFAALAPRSVIPRLDLVLYLSAFWASFPCLFCSLSHIFYYTIKSLFWTLPNSAWAIMGARERRCTTDVLSAVPCDLSLRCGLFRTLYDPPCTRSAAM